MAGRRGQLRKCAVADGFDRFRLGYSGGRRGWAEATDRDVYDYCCYLDSQGNGTTWVHERACPRVGSPVGNSCPPQFACAQRYAAASMRTGVVSKLKMALKEQLGKSEAWDPVAQTGNPCCSPLVDSYLTFTMEEQKSAGVPVKQADPMLVPVLMQLLRDMSSRAHAVSSLKERISITRDVALYALAFASMRRGNDLSFALGSQVLSLPEGDGLIFGFQFGKTLRDSQDSVLVSPDKACPDVCPVRAVLAYISAAEGIGWDLSQGHLFPTVADNGARGELPLTAAQMTARLQHHLRAAGISPRYTMHSFRVGAVPRGYGSGCHHADGRMEDGECSSAVHWRHHQRTLRRLETPAWRALCPL